MLSVNGISIVHTAHAPEAVVTLPAIATDTWNADDVLWYDEVNNVVKKMTDNLAASLNAIVGIATVNKLAGEDVAAVLQVVRIRAKITSVQTGNTYGKAVVPTYATGKYTFAVSTAGACGHLVEHEPAQNAITEIDLNLSVFGQKVQAFTAAV